MNLFGAIACLLVGPMALTYAIIHLVRFARCRHFPGVDGKLLPGIIEFASVGGGDMGGGYVPKITYSYSVATKRYTSSDIYSICGSAFASEDEALQFCRDLKAKPFTVYYNPINPGDAFLRNGPAVAIVLPLSLGRIFTIDGIYLIFL